MHRVSSTPITADGPVRDVEGTDCGAIVTFVGTVRDHNRGKQVVRLEYETFDAMALKVFAQIEAHCAERWKARVAIHHRSGACAPGEISVVIAAACPHRGDAFEACRYAIEQLKADAPIWKHEFYPDGSTWVGLGS